MGEPVSAKIKRYLPELLRGVDTSRLEQIARDHAGTPYARFFEPEIELTGKLALALTHLKIDTQPRTILDIGAGAGWFAHLARRFWHTVDLHDLPHEKDDGEDHPATRIYDSILDVLGLKVNYRFAIHPLQVIPQEVGRYDLITVFGGTFHVGWYMPEWVLFLRDVLRDHLNPGGCLFLHLKLGEPYADATDTVINGIYYRRRWEEEDQFYADCAGPLCCKDIVESWNVINDHILKITLHEYTDGTGTD